MKDFIKKNLATLIVAGAGLLAFIFCLFLPGIVASNKYGATKFSLINFMLGIGKYTSESTSGVISKGSIDGGLSIFGLLSFICLIAGIGLTIASIFIKDKKLDFIGSILIVVAGIFAFMLLVAGTDVTQKIGSQTVATSFSKTFQLFKLGAGAYVYGILAILGGGFGIANKFLKIVK